MIKLSLIAGGMPMQRTFFQKVVILGPVEGGSVDFPLPLSLESHESIALIDEGDRITLTNLTFDRLVQVDGRAVVSQTIESGQTIGVDGVSILFEGVPESVNEEGSSPELSEEEIDRWIQELEMGHPSPPLPQHPQEVGPIQSQGPRKVSPQKVLAGDFLKAPPRLFEGVPRKFPWWPVVGFAALFLFGTLLITATFALRLSNQRAVREASRTLGDLSMALLHAQIEGDHPPSVEPLASSFIGPHLRALLSNRAPTERNPLFQYKLYSSRDFSRFLLVADPTSAGPWRRLAPLPLLVVSSEELVVRVGHEQADLRRLLGWTRTLDKVPIEELEMVIDRMEPLSLRSLAIGTSEEGWVPLEEADSATLFYLANAPRYPQFVKEDREKEAPQPPRSLAAHVEAEANRIALQRIELLKPVATQIVELVQSHLQHPSSVLPLSLAALSEELMLQEERFRDGAERAIADLRLLCSVSDSSEALQALNSTLERHGLEQLPTRADPIADAADLTQLKAGVSTLLSCPPLSLDLIGRHALRRATALLDKAEEGERRVSSADLTQLEGIVRLFGCSAERSWFELVVRCDQLVAEATAPPPQAVAPVEEEPVEELLLPPPMPTYHPPQRRCSRSPFRRTR